MREAELLGQNEGLGDADHRDAEDHVVADLRRLPGAGLAAMHDALAHLRQDRLGARKRLRRAAGHEGERSRPWRRRRRRRPARRGRQGRARRRAHAPCARSRRRWWRNRSPACPGAAAARMSPQTASTCLPAGSMVTITSASFTASRPEPTMSTPSAFACSQGGGHEIEAAHAVLRLDEIGGHRAAHVAEADEGDGGHVRSACCRSLSAACAISFPARRGRAPTISRMTSLVPSRIWWTRRSRTIFSMP